MIYILMLLFGLVLTNIPLDTREKPKSHYSAIDINSAVIDIKDFTGGSHSPPKEKRKTVVIRIVRILHTRTAQPWSVYGLNANYYKRNLCSITRGPGDTGQPKKAPNKRPSTCPEPAMDRPDGLHTGLN